MFGSAPAPGTRVGSPWHEVHVRPLVVVLPSVPPSPEVVPDVPDVPDVPPEAPEVPDVPPDAPDVPPDAPDVPSEPDAPEDDELRSFASDPPHAAARTAPVKQTSPITMPTRAFIATSVSHWSLGGCDSKSM